MNPRIKLVLMTAALLTVIVSGTGMAHPKARQQRTAQTDAKKSDPSVAAGRKASPASGCSLLTPAMIKKVLGDSFRSDAPRKAMPWYGGAWGWSCQYSSVDQRDAKIDFVVYAEASPTKAKQDFDKYSIAADSSKGNPSIGDSAYWVTPTKQEGASHLCVEGQGSLQPRDNSGERKTVEGPRCRIGGGHLNRRPCDGGFSLTLLKEE